MTSASMGEGGKNSLTKKQKSKKWEKNLAWGKRRGEGQTSGKIG